MSSVPILTYHKISCASELGLTTIKPDRFKSQVDILLNLKYCVLTFKQILNQPESGCCQVVITFDDGYESIHRHAVPVMAAARIPGVVFVVTDFIGKKNQWEAYSIQRKFMHLNRNQIIELHRLGFEIGSHGRRHVYLNNKPAHVLKTETEDSKKIIEDIIGDEVISFCYPYGKYNRRVVKYVKQAGYKFAVGNASLLHRKFIGNLELIRRTIYASDSRQSFLKKIGKLHSYHQTAMLMEWIIQRGAWVNILKQNLNHYE